MRLTETGSGAAVPTYIHFDHLGSAVAASSAAGGIIWRESYRPCGRTMIDPPENDGDTGFTGHLNSIGLVYMQARFYDPAACRFYSTDPVGYQDQLNLYAYVYNDPVNYTDPTGECGPLSHICAGAFIGAIGGAISYAIETAGTDEFSGGGFVANTLKGAAIGAAVASGAGLGTVAVVGGTANAVEDVATAIGSNEGVNEGIANYTDGAGGAAGALAKSLAGGAAEAVVGGKAARVIGNAVTKGLEKAATSTSTAATDTTRGALSGLAEPIGDVTGAAAVAGAQRAISTATRDDDMRTK